MFILRLDYSSCFWVVKCGIFIAVNVSSCNLLFPVVERQNFVDEETKDLWSLLSQFILMRKGEQVPVRDRPCHDPLDSHRQGRLPKAETTPRIPEGYIGATEEHLLSCYRLNRWRIHLLRQDSLHTWNTVFAVVSTGGSDSKLPVCSL